MTSRLTELRALLNKHEGATHWYDRDFANRALMDSISALIDVAEAAQRLKDRGAPLPRDLFDALTALTRADDEETKT